MYTMKAEYRIFYDGIEESNETERQVAILPTLAELEQLITEWYDVHIEEVHIENYTAWRN